MATVKSSGTGATLLPAAIASAAGEIIAPKVPLRNGDAQVSRAPHGSARSGGVAGAGYPAACSRVLGTRRPVYGDLRMDRAAQRRGGRAGTNPTPADSGAGFTRTSRGNLPRS
jgi:hypothetical protein